MAHLMTFIIFYEKQAIDAPDNGTEGVAHRHGHQELRIALVCLYLPLNSIFCYHVRYTLPNFLPISQLFVSYISDII